MSRESHDLLQNINKEGRRGSWTINAILHPFGGVMGSVLLSRVVVASLLAGLVACQGGYTPPTCETVSPCKCRYPSGNGFDLSNATVVPEVPMYVFTYCGL